jgi:hypothetical protein
MLKQIKFPEVAFKMSKYECVQVNHHKEVGPIIEKYQKNGWQLHTYQATGADSMSSRVNHYLLFEKDDKEF